MPLRDDVSRSDLILAAITHEIEQFRGVIDGNHAFNRIVITVHLSSGGGHPRGIQCNFDHQGTFDPATILNYCGKGGTT